MSSESVSTDDLSYLRKLAEAGRDAPLGAGPYLVCGGGWFALASAIIGLSQLGVLPSSPQTLMWQALLGAVVGFAASLLWLLLRTRQQAINTINRVVGAAWTGVGLGIFVFWLAIYIMVVRTGNVALMMSISPAVLTLYGVAWYVSAAISGRQWMKGVALLTALSLLVVALGNGTPYGWLTYALALVLCAVLPGFYLMRLAARA